MPSCPAFAMTSAMEPEDEATSVLIFFTASDSRSYSCSVASTVLRTPVKALSNSTDALKAAVPSASTGVVSAAVMPLPTLDMAVLTAAHLVPKAVSVSPALVHADCIRASLSVVALICASVRVSAACAWLRFVRALVTASALFCRLLVLAASWPSSFLTSAEDSAYSCESASKLALAAMVAELESPSSRWNASYCFAAAATFVFRSSFRAEASARDVVSLPCRAWAVSSFLFAASSARSYCVTAFCWSVNFCWRDALCAANPLADFSKSSTPAAAFLNSLSAS